MKFLLLLLTALTTFGQTIRINSGQLNSNFVDTFGNTWLTDRLYTGGTTFPATTNVPEPCGNIRYGTTFSYQLPVAPGDYTINLCFQEQWMTAPGTRVFNVGINGTPVISNLDLFATAGTQKLVKSFDITTTGPININFSTTVRNAIVGSIEVISKPPVVISPLDLPVVGGSIKIADKKYIDVWPEDQATWAAKQGNPPTPSARDTVLFSDAEIPTGVVNGTNTVFQLAHPPNPVASLQLYRNGLLYKQGDDYSLSGKTVTFRFAVSTPQPTDNFLVFYRYVLGDIAPIPPQASTQPTFPTMLDLGKQGQNPVGLVEPQQGTIVVCVVTNCKAYPSGAAVAYRSLPPASPGDCDTEGTAVFSVDENGFLYMCSPPWWDMQRGTSLPVGTNKSVWVRTQAPMVALWTSDRPEGQPTN